jgi:hypothetical protein
MTLTKLLEIDIRLLGKTEDRALAFAERLWNAAGGPRQPATLINVLESVLRACEREGLWYPKILLARKKQLERGTWKPPDGPSPMCAVAPKQDGPACPKCGGQGYVLLPSGMHGSLCECQTQRRKMADA